MLIGLNDPLPGQAPRGLGYVYVLEYENGATKIGHSSNPSQRVGTHDGYARVFERRLVRCWLSPPCHWHKLHEQVLLAKATEWAGEPVLGGEWFLRLDVDRLLTLAQGFDYETVGSRRFTQLDFDAELSVPPENVLRRLSGTAGTLLRAGLGYPAYRTPPLDDLRVVMRRLLGETSKARLVSGLGELGRGGYYAERRILPNGITIRLFCDAPHGDEINWLREASVEEVAATYIASTTAAEQ